MMPMKSDYAVTNEYAVNNEYAVIRTSFHRTGTLGEMAVLCRKKDASRIEEHLKSLKSFVCPDTSDAGRIDLALAEFAEGEAPDGEYVIAALARPDVETTLSCGAVIGCKGTAHRPANQQLIEVGQDLWQWAYPGVCGFTLHGTRTEAEEWVDCVFHSIQNQKEPWIALQSKTEGHCFIYVSDSTGKACFTEGVLKAGNEKGASL